MIIAVNKRRPKRVPSGSWRLTLQPMNVPTEYRNSEYWVWLNDMKNYFEEVISAPAVTLNVEIYFYSMGGSTLGSCGVRFGSWNSPNNVQFVGSDKMVSMQAYINFNTDYFQVTPENADRAAWKKQFFAIALHECFHGLGMGQLWNGDFKIWDVYAGVPIRLPTFSSRNIVGIGDPGGAGSTPPNPPRYTANNALNAYREQMVGQETAQHILIEDIGMTLYNLMSQTGGTALSHWKELNGIYDRKGRNIYNETMTGWTGRDEDKWISRFTIAHLRDLGYTVSLTPTEIPIREYKSVHTV